MTVAAQLRGVMRDREPGVIEGGSRPGRGRVARLTRGGETRRHVIRVRRRLVVCLVTGIAVGGSTRVNPTNVATGARNVDMRPGQREPRQVVVEARRSPRRGRVAHVALGGESRRLMIGIVSAVVIVQMAGGAGGAQVCELAAHMATLAAK